MVKKVIHLENNSENGQKVVKRFEDYVPKKVIKRRYSHNQSLFPLGAILAIVFLIISFIYFGSHRFMMSGFGHVAFTPSFSIISWFYWVLVALIAIILWQMLD